MALKRCTAIDARRGNLRRHQRQTEGAMTPPNRISKTPSKGHDSRFSRENKGLGALGVGSPPLARSARAIGGALTASSACAREHEFGGDRRRAGRNAPEHLRVEAPARAECGDRSHSSAVECHGMPAPEHFDPRKAGSGEGFAVLGRAHVKDAMALGVRAFGQVIADQNFAAGCEQ